MRNIYIVRFCLPLAFLIFILSNCGVSTSNSTPINFEELVEFNYAKGLKIYKTNEGHVVTILNPSSGEIVDHFLVSEKKRSELTNIKFIQTPINNVLAYSSTYISFIDALGEIEKIKGVTYSQGLFNEKIKKQLASAQTIDVGSDQEPDKELIVSLNPDLALIYPSNGNHDWFSDFDIPTIANVEYLETHPLAQAEWIKLYGILFQKQQEADSIFSSIEKQYKTEIVGENDSQKPTLLCGELYDNVWTLPGGKSLTAQLINDAGGDYFYTNDTTTGSKKLDFEYILKNDKGWNYWLLLTYDQKEINLTRLENKNERYKYLSVFDVNKIGVCNTAKTPYFERGLMEPHILLREIKSLLKTGNHLDSCQYIKPIAP
ncbi:MAG: ABC transporter substrate-binding protein [Flavobacteriales bacterium]